jgi:hypothetical protein
MRTQFEQRRHVPGTLTTATRQISPGSFFASSESLNVDATAFEAAFAVSLLSRLDRSSRWP